MTDPSLTIEQHPSGADLILEDMPEVVSVSRLTAGGVREYLLRDTETSGGALLVRDGEVPHNTESAYAVEDADGDIIATGSIIQTSDTAWLKAPGRPDVYLETWVTDASPGWESKARAGVFDVVGSPFPLIVDDVRQAPSMTIEIFTATKQDEAMLHDTIKSVVLFEPAADDLHRDRGYYHVGDVSKAVQVSGTRGTVWRLPLQATLRPQVDFTANLGMWDLIVERWATWQDLVDEGYSSWLDLIRDL